MESFASIEKMRGLSTNSFPHDMEHTVVGLGVLFHNDVLLLHPGANHPLRYSSP